MSVPLLLICTKDLILPLIPLIFNNTPTHTHHQQRITLDFGGKRISPSSLSSSSFTHPLRVVSDDDQKDVCEIYFMHDQNITLAPFREIICFFAFRVVVVG